MGLAEFEVTRAFQKSSGGKVHVNLEPKREVRVQIGMGVIRVPSVGQRQRKGRAQGEWGSGWQPEAQQSFRSWGEKEGESR